MFDIYEVIFEIYVQDKLIKRQKTQAPAEILIMSFVQNAEKIRNDKRPIKIKMIRPEIIWDNFEQKQKVLNKEIAISNDAMVAWEDSNSKE